MVLATVCSLSAHLMDSDYIKLTSFVFLLEKQIIVMHSDWSVIVFYRMIFLDADNSIGQNAYFKKTIIEAGIKNSFLSVKLHLMINFKTFKQNPIFI